MTNLKINWFRTSVLMFILSAILYLLFLVLFRYNLRPTGLLFLISTISMTVAIAYQIFKHRLHPGSEKIILFEILLFTLLIFCLYIIPCRAGVRGDDFPQYFYSTKLVMEYGWPIPSSILSQYGDMSGHIHALSHYFTLNMSGGITSIITSIDLITSCLWLPAIWSTIGVLAVYLISKLMFNDKRAALLAALGFSTYSWSVELHSQYIRETIAFVILLFAIYAFYYAYQRGEWKPTILSILFTISIVLAHYFVPVIWIILLLMFAFSSKFIDYLAKQGKFQKNSVVFILLFTIYVGLTYYYINSLWMALLIAVAFCLIFVDHIIKQKKISLPSRIPHTLVNRRAFWFFIFLVIVMTFAYWMYIETSVIPLLTHQVQNVMRYGSFTVISPASTITLKENILRYIGLFFAISFSGILLLTVIKKIRDSGNHLKEYFFIAAWFATICFIIPGILRAYPNLLSSERLLVFGIPLMLIGVSYVASTMSRGRICQIMMALVVLFVINNLFILSAPSENPFDSWERVELFTIENDEYVYTGYHMPQDSQGIAAIYFYQDVENANFTRWFKVGDEKFFTEATEEEGSKLYEIRPYTKSYIIRSTDSYLQQNKIYNNGKVEIYK